VHSPAFKKLPCKVLRGLLLARIVCHDSVFPYLAPWVLQNLVDIVSLLDIAI
jgi:hypothetical protein